VSCLFDNLYELFDGSRAAIVEEMAMMNDDMLVELFNSPVLVWP
jgi:D-lyxose ketol-isomerase